MRKIALLLIVLMVVSIGFLSGCINKVKNPIIIDVINHYFDIANGQDVIMNIYINGETVISEKLIGAYEYNITTNAERCKNHTIRVDYGECAMIPNCYILRTKKYEGSITNNVVITIDENFNLTISES